MTPGSQNVTAVLSSNQDPEFKYGTVQVRYCSSTVLFKEDIKQEYPQKSSDMATKEAAVRAVSSARGAIGISKVWTPYQS